MHNKSSALFLFLLLSAYSVSGFTYQSGVMLANSCAGCHGTKGVSSSNTPGLSMLSSDEILLEMKAFKSGERQSTVMGRIAKGFNDEQLKKISIYLGLKK